MFMVCGRGGGFVGVEGLSRRDFRDKIESFLGTVSSLEVDGDSFRSVVLICIDSVVDMFCAYLYFKLGTKEVFRNLLPLFWKCVWIDEDLIVLRSFCVFLFDSELKVVFDSEYVSEVIRSTKFIGEKLIFSAENKKDDLGGDFEW
jgi:hypothetical protein